MSAAFAITSESRNGATVRHFFIFSSVIFIVIIFMALFNVASAYASTDVGGSINQSTEWTIEGSPYLVSGYISVEQGATLTIDSGVIVKFGHNSYLTVKAGGSLNATNVIFTSYKDDINGGDTDGGAYLPAAGDWGYIGFTGGGIIDNCMILDGGGLYGAAGNAAIYINGDSPTITNSKIISSKRSGIWIDSGTPSITDNQLISSEGPYGIYAPYIHPTALHGNRITDNANATAIFLPAAMGQGIVFNNSYSGNKINAMLLNGDVNLTTDWPYSNAPYNLNGGTRITGNSVLNIESDVVVKPHSSGHNGSYSIEVQGGSTLYATGVTFTSYFDDTHGGDGNGDRNDTTPVTPLAGDWGTIHFNGGGGKLERCFIYYGGHYQSTGEILISSGNPLITGTTVDSSSTAGIYIASGNPAISGNTITNNSSGGIYAACSPSAFNGNTISNNRGYAATMPVNIGIGNVSENRLTDNQHNVTLMNGSSLTQSTQWPASNAPYVLSSGLTIELGASFTVNDAIVKFQQGGSILDIKGSLAENNTIFTSYKDDTHGGDSDGNASTGSPGDWGTIFFEGGTGIFNGGAILYGGQYLDTGEIYINGSSPLIDGTIIGFSSTSGIYVDSGSPSITNSNVIGNEGEYGVYLSTSPSALNGNQISNNINATAVLLPATLGRGVVFNNTYGGNKRDAMWLSGNVTATSDWPATNSPYVINVSGATSLPSGTVLSIDTGAVVKFLAAGHNSTTNLIINNECTLNATGAIFTSFFDDLHGGDSDGDAGVTNPEAGDWGNIQFIGGNGSLNGCFLYYGGHYASTGAVYVNGSSPLITGTTIDSSSTSGIYVDAGAPSITTNTVSNAKGQYGVYLATLPTLFTGNNITGNDSATAVQIPASLGQRIVENNNYSGNRSDAMYLIGDVTATTDWPASNSPYVVQSSSISNSSTLTIGEGVIAKFPTNYHLDIIQGSSLYATRSTFTSEKDDEHGGDTNGDDGLSSPDDGDWGYIGFVDGGGSIDGCTILYGGGLYGAAGNASVYINGGSPTVTGTTVTKSRRAGIWIDAGTPTIMNNTLTGNGGDYGIYAPYIHPAALSGNRIVDNANATAIFLPAALGQGKVHDNSYSGNKINAMLLDGDVDETTDWLYSNAPYNLNGGTSITNNAALAIESNVVIKPYSFGHNGSYSIQVPTGSTLNATGAIFTSYFDDTHGGDANADGGQTSPMPGDWGTINFNGGNGKLEGCTVLYGGNYITAGEVYVSNSSSPLITGSTISNSSTSGVFVDAGSPSIHYNDIFGNVTGVSSNVDLDATNNYWGSKNGPAPSGPGNGVSGLVNYEPWSDVAFTDAGQAYQSAMGMAENCGMCGDPINTATGSYVYQHQDISIRTKGVPLEFQRTYNSNDRNDGILGYGWSHSWQISINPLANGNIDVLRGDGRQDVFSVNPDSTYSPPPGIHDTLSKNPEGTFKLVSQDQVTYNFNAANRITTAVSDAGLVTTYNYDVNRRLQTIVEPAGRTLTFTYNAENRIDEITDPQGNTVSLLYSPAGDLSQVTDQNGSITRFYYDAAHHLTRVTDPNYHSSANNVYDVGGKVTSQTDAEGRLITFVYDDINHKTTMTRTMDATDPAKDETMDFYYDSLFRLVRQTDPLGKDSFFTYDARGNRDSVIDRRGKITKEVFDNRGNVADIYKAYGDSEQEHTSYSYNSKNHPLTKTDSHGQLTTLTYDTSGTFLMQIDYPQVTNSDGSTASYSESFAYNTDGTLATFTDRNGDVTTYTYDSLGYPATENRNINRAVQDQIISSFVFDSLGRKVGQVDGNGNATTFDYDNLGRPRHQTRQATDPGTGQLVDIVAEYRYDDAGNLVQKIDPERRTTAFDYSPMNQLTRVTDARLNTVEYTYDAAYNRTAIKDRNGNLTNFGYDKNNWLTSTIDPENNLTIYGLDEEGNRTSATDPLGRTVSRTYDSLGRQITLTEPDEGGATRTTTYSYDRADNLISATDPLNHTTAYFYDELSRQKQATDPLGNSTFTAYDGIGNVVKMKDGNGNETSYAYSANDFLTSVTDPTGGLTSYNYDKVGNRTSQTDGEGHTTLYGFDEIGRLTNEKVDAGGGSYLLERSFRYDKAGNLKQDINGQGTIGYGYDDTYNLTSITDRQGATYSFTYDANQNQLTAVENATNKTVSFAYNPRGLLSESTDAFGAVENFAYDGAGNLTSRQDTFSGHNFTTSYTYTPRNQLKTMSEVAGTSTFTYDAAGNLKYKFYPDGMNNAYSYDADNRVINMESIKNNGLFKQWFTQGYDAAGNITSKHESTGLYSTTYSYDGLNRLTGENIGGYGNIAYAYDHTGNRTTLTSPASGTTNYSYNNASQLTSEINNGATTNYSYNDGGALLSKTTGSDTTSYSYNGMDKVTQISTPQTTVNYGYDALGRRIQRVEGTDTRNLHMNGKSDLADYWSNPWGTTMAIGRGPDGVISLTLNPATNPMPFYQLYSPHGDVTLVDDQNANTVWGARYDSFGNVIAGEPNLYYGYLGLYERNQEMATHTVEMGVRDYEPRSGRLQSADPLRGLANNPQSRNRYEYSFNNPLLYQDLDGMFPDLIGGAKAFAGEARDEFINRRKAEYYMVTHPGEMFDDWKEGVGIAWNNPGDVPGATLDMMVMDDVRATFSECSTPFQRFMAGGRLATTALLAYEGTAGALSRSSAAAGMEDAELANGIRAAESASDVLKVGERELKLNEHALLRMGERSVVREQIANTIANGEEFRYYHEGVWKTGHYDKATKMFVAEYPPGVIKTAFKASPQYIDGLKGKTP